MRPLPLFFLALALCLAGGAATATADESLPGAEAMLAESEVEDRFFAYVLGIIARDITAEIPRSHLSRILSEYDAEGDIPFQQIRSIERNRLTDRERLLAARFMSKFEFPFPYRFLGLPIGSVRTSGYLALSERVVGSASYRNDAGETLRFESVHEFRLAAGKLTIDFRTWIDLILGRFVEDVDALAGLVFRHEGTWYTLVAGRDRRGELRAGGYDFKNDRGLLPVPDRFSGIAERLAQRLAAE